MFVRSRMDKPLTFRKGGKSWVIKPHSVTLIDDPTVTAREIKGCYGSRVDVISNEGSCMSELEDRQTSKDSVECKVEKSKKAEDKTLDDILNEVNRELDEAKNSNDTEKDNPDELLNDSNKSLSDITDEVNNELNQVTNDALGEINDDTQVDNSENTETTPDEQPNGDTGNSIPDDTGTKDAEGLSNGSGDDGGAKEEKKEDKPVKTKKAQTKKSNSKKSNKKVKTGK